jgi:hypothetical protein
MGGQYYKREQRAFSKRIKEYVDKRKQEAEHTRRNRAARKAAETRRLRSGKIVQKSARRSLFDYFKKN